MFLSFDLQGKTPQGLIMLNRPHLVARRTGDGASIVRLVRLCVAVSVLDIELKLDQGLFRIGDSIGEEGPPCQSGVSAWGISADAVDLFYGKRMKMDQSVGVIQVLCVYRSSLVEKNRKRAGDVFFT